MKKIVLMAFAILNLSNWAFSQTLKVNDTDFSKGRLGNIQTVELQDLVKFHGHLCDGLVEGFVALQYGLYQLFPDSLIDRTNLRIVSKPSPCLTDVAVYLTGARYQFGTFYVSNDFEGLYVVQRIDNAKTVNILRMPNVKPEIIDLMGKQAIAGNLAPCDLEKLRRLEDDYTLFLQQNKPENLFELKILNEFVWQPVLKNDFIKTDILNKNAERCNK
ncbi:formylmethanofuran dehydrogenase subunit E family protein [Rhodoflexus caldus]|uniref:formylmethanofuran dehydrogenase subunit E family protein n=1 Tax=Rhodoflexus caldus TaxID=2891236 RepID=UPI00202A627C|nr:formylmethanofuran dehydrogenase subunit E family protein [Rhodoflexus caldus]